MLTVIVVFGATGNIGRHLVPDLLARGESVRAITRDPAAARAILDPAGRTGGALEVEAADLSAPDVAMLVPGLLRGADAVFLATPGGPEQPAQEGAVLRAVAAAGIQRLTKVSVIGPAHDSPVPPARWQAEIEQQARDLDLPATVLRPNWFDENFLASAATITGQGAFYGCAGHGRVGFVDSRDTAAVAAVTLTEGRDGRYAGRELTITGPESLTFAEAADRLTDGLVRPVAYVDLSEDDFSAALTGAGLPPAVADLLVAINRNAREGNLAEVSDTVTTLTGRPARSLNRWAADNKAAFHPAA